MHRTTMGLVAAAWMVGCTDARMVAESSEPGAAGASQQSDGGAGAVAGASSATGGSKATGGQSPGGASEVTGDAGAPERDPDLLSDCESNKVATGGYWWSYTDPAGLATIAPKTDLVTAFPSVPGSYDGSHACRVTGSVPEPAPEPSSDRDECQEPAYPHAGLGLSFRARNVAYDLSGMAGVSFWAKSGSGPGTVNVAVAQTSTEIPLAVYNDDFDSTCLCTEAAREAGEKKSCQGHYYVPVELAETWQQCWVFFRDMAPPFWAQDKGFDPTQAIKLMWQMPEPGPDNGDMPFDVWVDDVKWITEAAVTNGGLPTATFCGHIDFQ